MGAGPKSSRSKFTVVGLHMVEAEAKGGERCVNGEENDDKRAKWRTELDFLSYWSVCSEELLFHQKAHTYVAFVHDCFTDHSRSGPCTSCQPQLTVTAEHAELLAVA